MNTEFRSRLSMSALAAATSFIALSAPAAAQSICSAAGTAVTCTPGGTTATLSATGSLFTGGQGLTITDTAPLALTLGGTLSTDNADPALVAATTTGDLTITAATGGAVNLVTTGTGTGAVLQSQAGAVTATLGTLTTTGAITLETLAATGANVTTGAITATGLQTVSVPGVGIAGLGAVVTSTAGPASLTVNGNLTASGSADPLIGALTYAPAGDATTTINGAVAVTDSAGFAIGVETFGSTSATTTVTGTTSATGTTEALGLLSFSTSGPAVVNAGGNVTASGAVATGVQAIGDSVSIVAPNATITATDTDAGGTDAIGVQAQAVNALTINTGKIVSSGNGVVAATTGGTTAALNVTVKGVQAGTNGILVSAVGSTPITVNSSAPVTVASGGALGISATGVDGLVTVSEAGVSGVTGGVLAQTTGAGSVVVNATGGTTTATGGHAIQVLSGSSATVNVASGATVSGQGTFDALNLTSGTGTGMTNTVNIAGTVTAAGTGKALTAVGGPATVNVNSGGTLTGPVVLTGGADTVTVNSGGTFRPTGTVDFGAGNDTLSIRSGGTLQLTPTSSFLGLEVLNNAGTLGFGAGTVSLAGVGAFTNSGTLSATGGATAITGLTTLTNTGTISMVDADATDVLTLGTAAAPTNYVGGTGARLAINATSGLTAADKLVVNGNISGTTVVDVTTLGGATGTYNPTGVVIVDGTGTVSANAFTLAPISVQAGLLNYGLRQSGNDTFLVSTLDPSFTDIAMIGSLGRDMWYQSFDAYHDAVQGRHAGSLDSGNTVGIWGQLYESKDRYGDFGRTTTVNNASLTYSDRLETRREGAQLGLEFRGPGFVIGATGGWERARNENVNDAAQMKAEGHNYGAYALFGMSSGIYGGLLVKRDDYDVSFSNIGRQVNFDQDAHSTGVDGEIGLKTGNTGAIGFDFNAGLSWVKTHIDPWNQYGLTFDWQNNRSLRGRLGARVLFPSAMGAYLGAKVFHEFKDNDGFLNVAAANGNVAAIDLAHRGTWVRLEGGLGGNKTQGLLLGVWGDLGDTHSIGARVGFRF